MFDASGFVGPAFRHDAVIGEKSGQGQVDSAGFAADVEDRDNAFPIKIAGDGDYTVGSPEELEPAASQSGPLPTQGNQSLKLVQKLAVPAFGLVPGKGTPVGRIVAAGHADFIAVINRRRTRINHLKQGPRSRQGRLVVSRLRLKNRAMSWLPSRLSITLETWG